MKKSVLKKYAELIVKKGLNVQKGQEVDVVISPEQVELARLISYYCYKAGAKTVRFDFTDDELVKNKYKYESLETLSTPNKMFMAKLENRVENMPCRLFIEDSDPDALKGVDQAKIANTRMKLYPIMKPYLDKVEDREQWCIAGAASIAWAKKVFPGVPAKKAKEMLWDAILETSRMCDNPIEAWNEHNKNLKEKCDYLNNLGLKELQYKSSNGTDFKVGLIEKGLFIAGAEKALGSNIVFNPNIPSEECFTSPKRGCADGIVYATKPLSYNGELIEDFSVRFENGKVVEVKAKKGEELLKKMIAMDEGASYLGECALIPFDSPINNTNILFLSTLYDENASCHLALGSGFNNCLRDFDKMTNDECKELGINDSMIHVDFMIGSKDMDIVGVDKNGNKVQIFKNGNWAF